MIVFMVLKGDGPLRIFELKEKQTRSVSANDMFVQLMQGKKGKETFYKAKREESLHHTKGFQRLHEPWLSEACLLVFFRSQFEAPDSVQRLGGPAGRVSGVEESTERGSCQGEKTPEQEHHAATSYVSFSVHWLALITLHWSSLSQWGLRGESGFNL